jgi:hypothetical protein
MLPAVPGAGGIGVVVGAPGVVAVAGGSELPVPIPVVVLLPTVPPGDVPSLRVPLDVPIVPVVVLGKGAVVLPAGPGVVAMVPPVVFGKAPVVALGAVGVVAVPPAPRLVPPPPAPRLELPLPIPALPPAAEPAPTPPDVPPAAPPAANAAGPVRISNAAVATVNRFMISAVIQFTLTWWSPAARAAGALPG